MRKLKDWVRRHPDATLAEIKTGMGLSLSIAAIDRAVKVLGLTLKKSRFARLSRTVER